MGEYENLQNLLEYLDEARPAPWVVEDDNKESPMEYAPYWVVTTPEDDGGGYFVELRVGDEPTAEFIAEARNMMGELLKENADLRQQIQQIEKVSDQRYDENLRLRGKLSQIHELLSGGIFGYDEEERAKLKKMGELSKL